MIEYRPLSASPRRLRPFPPALFSLGMLAGLGCTILPPARAADGTGGTPDQVAARQIRFNRDIRPIFSDKCFQCHGPDATQRKGKLRLDSQQAATAPAGSGSPAIVPGK